MSRHVNKLNILKCLFNQERHMSTLLNSRYEYNQLLRTTAKTFKNSNQGQLEAQNILQEMKKRGIEPNSQSYIQLIIGLSLKRHRSYKQNERLESWFNDFLSTLEKNKRPIPKIKKVFESMAYKGHPNMKHMFIKTFSTYRDIDCIHFAIEGCIKAKNYQDAEELLEFGRKKQLIHLKTYDTMIEHYLKHGQLQSASKVFSVMLQDNIMANYSIYEKFIRYYLSVTEPTEDTFETVDKLWQAILLTKEEIKSALIIDLLQYFKIHKLSSTEQIILDVIRSQKLDRKCLGEIHHVIGEFVKKKQLLSAISLYYELLGNGYSTNNKLAMAIMKNDQESGRQVLNIHHHIIPPINK